MSALRKQAGFTLVEMIGVLAVIAILASVAAPRILESIEDAKVSTFVQQVKALEGAVAKYNANTGLWPTMITTSDPSTNPHHHQLLINASNSAGDDIAGWQGPYVAKEPTNPFGKNSYQALYNTTDTNWTCDVDGDGTADGRFIVYRADNVTDKVAEKISDIFDGDGGSADWKTKGRVKRYQGTSASIIAVCLARI